MNGFQCYYSKQGDLLVCDGVVVQPRTGVRKLVGTGGTFSEADPDLAGADLTMVPTAAGSTFVGGSGRNVVSTGLEALSSGAPVPTGFFQPTLPGSFRLGIFTLTVTGPDDATIDDGTDVVAVLTTGGLAPVGDYDSTAYGQATYGPLILLVHQPFTLTVAAEDAAGGDIPACHAAPNAGTAQAGVFAPLAEDHFESVDDADWTVRIYADGTAELLYLTDVMAIRPDGDPSSPAGDYESTPLGMETFNLTDDEPIVGEAWTAVVTVMGRVPRTGFVFLEIVEVAGVLSAVNGPAFATALPAHFGETFYFPLAVCDGYALEQYHTGALTWDRSWQASYLVADLPSAVAAGAGARTFALDSLDALAVGIGTAVTGGGTEAVPVYSDGAVWRCG